MVDDDDGDDFRSPEPKTDSRSGLPGKNRRWRLLRIVKRNELFCFNFFLPKSEYIELELRSVEVLGAHKVGGRALGGAPPTLVDRVWAPFC